MRRLMTNRGLRAPLALVVLLALLVIGYAVAGGAETTLSGGGSPNAGHIKTLYLVTFVIGVLVFLGVEGALLYALINHRFRRGRPAPEQVRGNRRLEIGWTVGAALILVALTAVTFALLPSIENPARSGPAGLASAAGEQFASVDQTPPPGGQQLTVNVLGQQYIWRYDYPGSQPLFSYYDMYVPVNTTVVLNITSQDVDHSFWVPKLFGKADAVPGYTNHTWFKVTKPGVYTGNCAELCGENHAQMRNRVIALPVDRFKAWAARQSAGIREAQVALAAQRKAGEGQVGGGTR